MYFYLYFYLVQLLYLYLYLMEEYLTCLIIWSGHRLPRVASRQEEQAKNTTKRTFTIALNLKYLFINVAQDTTKKTFSIVLNSMYLCINVAHTSYLSRKPREFSCKFF